MDSKGYKNVDVIQKHTNSHNSQNWKKYKKGKNTICKCTADTKKDINIVVFNINQENGLL